MIINGNPGQHPAVKGYAGLRFLSDESIFENRGIENAVVVKITTGRMCLANVVARHRTNIVARIGKTIGCVRFRTGSGESKGKEYENGYKNETFSHFDSPIEKCKTGHRRCRQTEVDSIKNFVNLRVTVIRLVA
jgi:hypothetical protein